MCQHQIVPRDVLDRLSRDKQLTATVRKALADTSRVSNQLRALRDQAVALASITHSIGAQFLQIATAPKVVMYDAKGSQTLPGFPIANPEASNDTTLKRAFSETNDVADFYKNAFKRNSIDDAGMTLMSSVHYGQNFNNAMWTGTQMLYGDGDGQIFADFTQGNDVIGHELTHGVTQHTLQLVYANDSGGLNESISDCFGSMFRQWQASEDANAADWYIGKDIIGPAAQARGIVCLRNMANPADPKALAPQPASYGQVHPGMDPHYSSGPPNLAFCVACQTVGGNSWDTVGQVWYGALTTSGANPNMTMPQFAARTRQVAGQMFSGTPGIPSAIDAGWKQVGL